MHVLPEVPRIAAAVDMERILRPDLEGALLECQSIRGCGTERLLEEVEGRQPIQQFPHNRQTFQQLRLRFPIAWVDDWT